MLTTVYVHSVCRVAVPFVVGAHSSVKSCLQHMNRTRLKLMNWPELIWTSRSSYTARSLVTRVGVATTGWRHKLVTIIRSNHNRFSVFSLEDCKFAIKWLLKFPPLIAYVATLRLLVVCWPGAQVHQTATFLLVNLTNNHWFKKKFYW